MGNLLQIIVGLVLLVWAGDASAQLTPRGGARPYAQTFTSTGSFVVPNGVSTVYLTGCGAGGGGGGGHTADPGGGGGGGPR